MSGVQAAKAGAFAALGVARHDDEARLADAAADIVVRTLDDVDLATPGCGPLGQLTRRACTPPEAIAPR